MSSPRPHHVGRRLLVVAIVAALAVAALMRGRRVRLEVAGQAREIRSYAATVGELLERQGVQLAATDDVQPARATALAEGLEVQVIRAVDFRVVVPGRGVVREMRAPVTSVREALRLADVAVGPQDDVTPALDATVEDGARIRVRPARRVPVTVRGHTREPTTTAATVGGMLREAGVTVGPLDAVHPPVDSSLRGVERIVVGRLSFDTSTETVELAPGEQRRETTELLRGESRVVQEGRAGVRRDRYRLRAIDGTVVSRSLMSRTVITEPTPRVVEVGTRPPPPPPSPEDDDIWYRLADCESGGRWSLDGRYDGGLQFAPETWTRNKPAGYPAYAYQATPAQQIHVGKIVQSRRGWDTWAACAEQLGLT